MATRQSTVKWFDAKKGYGFIHHPDGGDDVFVHYTQIESDKDFKTLRTGQTVEFEMNDGPKGLHALSVNAIGEDEESGSSNNDVSSPSPSTADASHEAVEPSTVSSEAHGSSSGTSSPADSQPRL